MRMQEFKHVQGLGHGVDFIAQRHFDAFMAYIQGQYAAGFLLHAKDYGVS